MSKKINLHLRINESLHNKIKIKAIMENKKINEIYEQILIEAIAE